MPGPGSHLGLTSINTKIVALAGVGNPAISPARKSRQSQLSARKNHYFSIQGRCSISYSATTELWSRLLLPSDAPAARAAVEEAEALRRQLLDRARMRAAADWLERRMQLGRDAFRRGRPEVSAAGRGGDLTELLRACLPALQVQEEQAVAFRPRPPRLWTASDALGQFSRLLATLPDGSPLAAFLPRIDSNASSRALRCRAAVASTLIAGLERARDGALLLEQEVDWMPIRVSRRADDDPAVDVFVPPS
jgi:segregation and condensation protein A